MTSYRNVRKCVILLQLGNFNYLMMLQINFNVILSKYGNFYLLQMYLSK